MVQGKSHLEMDDWGSPILGNPPVCLMLAGFWTYHVQGGVTGYPQVFFGEFISRPAPPFCRKSISKLRKQEHSDTATHVCVGKNAQSRGLQFCPGCIPFSSIFFVKETHPNNETSCCPFMCFCSKKSVPQRNLAARLTYLTMKTVLPSSSFVDS